MKIKKLDNYLKKILKKKINLKIINHKVILINRIRLDNELIFHSIKSLYLNKRNKNMNKNLRI